MGLYATARAFLGYGNRWGVPFGGNLRGVHDTVVPVSVVEQIRDDDDGSYYGLQGRAVHLEPVTRGLFPSVLFANTETACLIHRIDVAGAADFGNPPVSGPYNGFTIALHVPIAPYNPVAVAGLAFEPGLTTNLPFTFGSAFSIGGFSVVGPSTGNGRNPPVLWNQQYVAPAVATQPPVASGVFNVPGMATQVAQLFGSATFDPPIRVYPDRVLCCTRTSTPTPNDATFLGVTFWYTEWPNLRGGQ